MWRSGGWAMAQASFDAVMAAAGVAEPTPGWRAGWEAAQADFPAGGVPFLGERCLDELNQVCRFPEDMLAPIRAVCARIRADEGLSRLAWLWQTLAYRTAEPPDMYGWPNPAALGSLAPMFPAAVQLRAGIAHHPPSPARPAGGSDAGHLPRPRAVDAPRVAPYRRLGLHAALLDAQPRHAGPAVPAGPPAVHALPGLRRGARLSGAGFGPGAGAVRAGRALSSRRAGRWDEQADG